MLLFVMKKKHLAATALALAITASLVPMPGERVPVEGPSSIEPMSVDSNIEVNCQPKKITFKRPELTIITEGQSKPGMKLPPQMVNGASFKDGSFKMVEGKFQELDQ